MKTILVIRLSSMGDVLLTLPVIRGVLDGNRHIRLVFITRKEFTPYFEGIERLVTVPFDPFVQHRGLTGLWRLFLQVTRTFRISSVIDLHRVLRTHVLGFFFLSTFHRVFRVRKLRGLKRRIIRKREQIRLPHTVIRYIQAFKKAGLRSSVISNPFSHLLPEPSIPEPVKGPVRIGIAPLSRHTTKNWGMDKVGELMHLIESELNAEVHLFGSAQERILLDPLVSGKSFNHAGIHDSRSELLIIRSMTVFISMDSANMHLAALAGVPVISVWGATHPDLGFAPLNQSYENILQASREEVPCRPCSVYGENQCHLSEEPMRCMKLIPSSGVFARIKKIIGSIDNVADP